METIGATEARANISALLRQVCEEGESFVIERRGRPRAMLVPIGDQGQADLTTSAESEALLSQDARMGNLGHWIWDELQDKCIHCSESLARMNGVTVGEYLARFATLESLLAEIHPDDRERYERTIAEAKQTKRAYDIEFRDLLPDGQMRYLRECGEPMLDDDGRLVSTIGTLQDVTENKRAVEALRKTDALFKETESLAKLGHWEWDEIGEKATYCSDELARLHGITINEYLSQTSSNAAELKWVHPEDQPRYQRALEDFKTQGTGFEIEYRLLQPSGAILEVLEVTKPIFDAQGSLIRSIGFVQDIGDRKRAEEELRRARDELELRVTERTAALQEKSAQLQSILDHSPTMIFLKDDEGHYLLANREFEQVFGTTNKAIRNKRPQDILPPRLAESSRAQELEVRRTGRPSTREETFEFDGRERTFLSSRFPVLVNIQQLIGIGTVATDITERKLAEVALRSSEARLAKTMQQAKLAYWNYRFAEQEIVDWSEEAANILGIAQRDLPKSFGQYLEIVHPEDRAHVAATYEIADPENPKREGCQIEYRIARPDGGIVWLQESAEVEHDADGTPVGYLGTIQDISETKKLGEELALSEARLRQAVELVGLGHWVWDALEDRCLYCSEAHARIHGMSVAEYTANASIITGPFSMVHPEDRKRVKAAFQALRNGKRMEVEYRVVTPEGDTRHVREMAAPVFDSNGTVVQEHGSIQDISEQKQAEEALRASEAQLIQAQHMARIGVFLWDDIEDRCLYCSEELAALLEMSVEEFMATRGSHTSILPWINADDRENYDAVIRDAFANATSYEVEYRVLDGSGNEQHWQEIGEPVLDERGRQVRTFGTVQDISALKQTEAALRENEEQLRLITDSLPVLIAYLDGEVRFVFANKAFEEWYELPRADIIGRPARDILGTDKFDQFRPNVDRVLAGESVTFEMESAYPDGKVRDVSVSYVPHFGYDSQVRGFFALSQDVSERRRIEKQLRQAQKLEAIGQLTGGVAHDFNNLLAVIMGNAELLAARHGDDEPRSQAVIRAATRGAELTERLLAFSRQQPLRPQAFDLDAAVSQLADMLRRTLGETIEMKISPTAELWTPLADPGQLENALLNLAINSRDAMPGGGKLVIETANVHLDDSYVSTHPEATAGDYVMLAVTDNGTGMTPEVLEHAFDPFFTTKEVGQGSGLGLSMVYGFVKQSDGHLAIYSEPGQGTSVKLYLPCTKAAAEEMVRKADSTLPKSRGETILVVEDNPDVRQLAVTLLEDLGYEVREAAEGPAALAILEGAPPPDLLLSDVVLAGGMSGPELAREAGRLFPGLKVLFMSGYAENAAHSNGLTGGHSELLNKPFHRRDLAHKVRSVLDG